MPASPLPVRQYGCVRASGPRPRRGVGHALSRDRADRPRDPARGVGAIGLDAVRWPAIATWPCSNEHVERARSGEGRVVEIVGEAGVGKSRLIFELRQRLQARRGDAACRAAAARLATSRLWSFHRDCRGPPCASMAHGPADAAGVVAKVCAIDASLESFVPLYLHLLSFRPNVTRCRVTCRVNTFRPHSSMRWRRSSPPCRSAPRSSCCSRTGTGPTVRHEPRSRASVRSFRLTGCSSS